MKFDVVVGNPPYQNSAAAAGRKTATKPLWEKFMVLGHDISIRFVAFITPSTWLSQGTRTNKFMSGSNLSYCKLYSKSPFKGVMTTVTWWLTDKNNTSSTFLLEDDNQLHMNTDIQTTFIPTSSEHFGPMFSVFNKFFAEKDKLNVVTTMKFHNEKRYLFGDHDQYYCYPVFHTNTQTKYTNVFDDELMNKHKVILSKTGSTRHAFVDFSSSTTNLGISILTDNEQQSVNLLNLIQSKLYRFVLENSRHSSTISTPTFKNLPAVDLERSWTDEELYKHFNLTQEEIDLIESTIS